MFWNPNPRRYRAIVPALVVALACTAYAQDGEVRLDVPYVPTPHSVVQRMLELADVGPNDYVIDLGSGDGRIAIAAARDYGARALGVDIDPRRVREGQENAQKAGVADRVTFRQQNLFETPIGDATVITMYLLTQVNLDLRPRLLQELRPGTRVVSHAFAMGDWKPDTHETVGGRDIYFWVIPARVDGQWDVRHGDRSFTVTIEQRFQEIQGTATIDGRAQPLRSGWLRGDRIEFAVDLGDGQLTMYRGRVVGDSIESTTGTGSTTEPGWRATRTALGSPTAGGRKG